MTAIRVCIGLAGHTGGNSGIHPLIAQEKTQKFPLEWANVSWRHGFPGRDRKQPSTPPLQADQEPCPMTFKIRYPLAIAVLFASQALVPALTAGDGD